MEYTLHFEVVLRKLPLFLGGLGVTAYFAVLAMFFGIIIGLFGALARRSKNRIAYSISTAYVELMRNTPLLIQMYLFYFGLTELGIPMGNYLAFALAISINNGAYCTEIIRAGLEGIHKTEIEAALGLGLSYPQTMIFVVFPHVFKIIYPPVCNQLILIILVTSLASFLGIRELTGVAREWDALHFRPIETYTVVMYLYVAITIAAMALLVFLGNKLLKVKIKVF
ncbi:amino acid ABC transporter permease [Candidatus Aerophobetes bacterium]|uniref:Amino acid ABC transporter permease n=1 Tax=Aerophobetes bacterium TaxID=2030807 RepID=A0A523S432_UNCAE|nr:MAG: amino acid ABC transporter permease [Candidatus Aerophobetes bacterium]